MATGWLVAALLKLAVQRTRPTIEDPFATHAGYSFPSGHATNNAIVVTVVPAAPAPGARRDRPPRAARVGGGLGPSHLRRPPAHGRALPVRRDRRSAARLRALLRVVRRLRGLEPTDLTTPRRRQLMTMLTRWRDDQSRPSPKEAGRDLAVRVLLPMTVWWLVVLAVGWSITDGPLKDLGIREERFNRWLASRAHVAPQRHHALLLLDRCDRQHHRRLRGRRRDRVVAHQAVVVRRDPADRDLGPGPGLLLHHAAHRPANGRTSRSSTTRRRPPASPAVTPGPPPASTSRSR